MTSLSQRASHIIIAATVSFSAIVPASATGPGVGQLMDALWQTSCTGHSWVRERLMERMQPHADSCSHTAWFEHCAAAPGSPIRAGEEGTVFQFYQEAFERVLNEVPHTEVKPGTVALWHLYNMGYVVKTPSHTFGIDIKHRDAEQLAPLLEFLCITHNHQDHVSMPLVDAMVAAGKPVYSNFLEVGQQVVSGDVLRPADGIEIVTTVVDHNPTLVNFVVDYEIDCGADTGHKVILHLGDSRNWEQLRKTKPVDILIPHLAVGLDMPRAVEKLSPQLVLMSHVMELSHPVDKWRWSYPYGLARCRDLCSALGLPPGKVLLPVWGEKIVY
ncbi:MAG: hypothetical protein K2L78_02590 [Muribaculaceae bacterium]|nr:hypothetical protein [Muribaculaceae bacterium]